MYDVYYIPTDGPMIIFLSVSFVMKRQLPATNFQIPSKNWCNETKKNSSSLFFQKL